MRKLLSCAGKVLEPEPHGNAKHFKETIAPDPRWRGGVAIRLGQDLDRQVAHLDVADEVLGLKALVANLEVFAAVEIVEANQRVKLVRANAVLGNVQRPMFEDLNRPRHARRFAGTHRLKAALYR